MWVRGMLSQHVHEPHGIAHRGQGVGFWGSSCAEVSSTSRRLDGDGCAFAELHVAQMIWRS